MRNRDYKQFAGGTYYHVYNRGVAKQDIFKENYDYSFFLHRLKENLFPKLSRGTLLYTGDSFYTKKTENKKKKIDFPRKTLPDKSFELVCYCLMPNHFHLLIKQVANVPVSKLILKVCTSYAMYFNKRHDRVGSLFQDTFKAISIEDNNYLFWLSAYIHKNPIEAGIVDDLKQWQWSSYLDYINERDGILCDKSIILEQLSTSKNYEKLMSKSISRVPLLEF